MSLANLANFALSISGAASLAPNVQYDLKRSSIFSFLTLFLVQRYASSHPRYSLLLSAGFICKESSPVLALLV